MVRAADPPLGQHVRMILRLDPVLPLVWRSPSSVQLGIDPPRVILEDVTPTQERLLAALVVGVSEPGLAMIAHGRTAELEELVELAQPALRVPSPSPVATVAVSGSETIVSAISATLAGSGIQVVMAEDAVDLTESAPALAIVTGHFVLAPELHALWLRRDVPHLPVVLSDTAIEIGPFVEPGTGPCLLCLELHRRDRDAAWPAVATQLLGRRSRAESPILLAETAAAVARLVLERLADGAGEALSTRIDAVTGERRIQQWLPHDECGCRGLATGQPGIDSVSAAPIGRLAGSLTS